MFTTRCTKLCLAFTAGLGWFSAAGFGPLPDRTRTPHSAHDGLAKALELQLGVGRGDALTPASSAFIIATE